MSTFTDSFGTCVMCNKSELDVSNLASEVFEVNATPTCGHKFCHSCTLREFHTKRTFKCPRCDSFVAKEHLKNVDVDELEAERDARIRIRHKKEVFVKTEEDFASMEEYRAYQEFVEDMIFNLVHRIDLERTNELIKLHKEENKKLIVDKRALKDDALEDEARRLKEEAQQREESDRLFQEKLQEEKIKKEERKKKRSMLGGEALLEEEDAIQENKPREAEPAVQQNNILYISEQHPLVRLLREKPDPQVVSKTSDEAHARPQFSKERTRKIHHAGGYDYNLIFHQRNLTEIKEQLKLCVSI